MEQENQNTKGTADTGATASAAAGNTPDSSAPTGAGTGGESQSFDQLMAASPTLSPLASGLKCLRKPAISVEYSLQKRHVPDLDKDNKKGGHTASGTQNTTSGSAESAQSGKNSDVMDVTGSFTIRYFDFALGILGMAIASCMAKGCGCLKRKMH